jgi:hypothetical protein
MYLLQQREENKWEPAAGPLHFTLPSWLTADAYEQNSNNKIIYSTKVVEFRAFLGIL